MAALNKIYAQPIERVVLCIFFLVAVWLAGNYFCSGKRWWQLGNALFAIVALYGILYFTVLRRSKDSAAPMILIPFHSFVAAKLQPEIYRDMLMNLFLFVPLGLSLPNALSLIQKRGSPVKTTVVVAFALSASIELCQYIFHMGYCELDDVIMNTLGALTGAAAYSMAMGMRSRKVQATRSNLVKDESEVTEVFC